MADPLFAPPPGPEVPLALLRGCHRRLEARLDTLARVGEVLAAGAADRHEAAAAAIAGALRHLDGAARLHVEDEEASLFPRLRRASARAEAVLAGLDADHRAIEDGWAALRPVLVMLEADLMAARPPDPAHVAALQALLPAFADAHRRHHAHEEREVLPLAEAVLDAAALAAIGAEMRARREA